MTDDSVVKMNGLGQIFHQQLGFYSLKKVFNLDNILGDLKNDIITSEWIRLRQLKRIFRKWISPSRTWF